jgi:hypothetical protein
MPNSLADRLSFIRELLNSSEPEIAQRAYELLYQLILENKGNPDFDLEIKHIAKEYPALAQELETHYPIERGVFSDIVTTLTSEDEFKYNVFISYSHKDEEWVVDTLLPTLEKTGLKVCIDFRDFVPGKPSRHNMRDACKESAYTLLVMTPAWLASEWTEFESLLAFLHDPSGNRQRTIPILLEKCDMPEDIRIFTYIDFTRKDREDVEWQRLFKALNVATGLKPKEINILHSEQTQKKNVQLNIEGNYLDFDEKKEQALVEVLAGLLNIESNGIRVLQVYRGSIIVVLEMPTAAANRLKKMAMDKEFRLRSVDIISIQVEGEAVVSVKPANGQSNIVDTPSRSRTPKPSSGRLEGVREIQTAEKARKKKSKAVAPKIFISYSHKAEKYKDELVKMLAPLQDQGVLAIWQDREIEPGDEWYDSIQNAMNTCDLALLLVSGDFLASPFIRDKELSRLLKRRKDEGLRIVPIIVSECLWQSVPILKDLQALPKNGKPVVSFTGLGKRDRVWTDISKAIESIAKGL